MSTNGMHNDKKQKSLPDLTQEDIFLMQQIKKSLCDGYDIEIKKASGGKIKVLEVSKKNIAAV